MCVFITDWDETATVADTTALIANVAQTKLPFLLRPFAYYSQIYADALKKVGSPPRDTVEMESLFQQKMKPIEMSSINALEQSRYFQGIVASEFKDPDLVAQVELRPGCVDLLKSFQGPKYILSVNWCRPLIEAVLNANGVKDVEVVANDFVVSSEGITTGEFVQPDIRTGHDKWVWMEQIRKNHPHVPVVYYGDSSTDVLPIVKADVGVITPDGRGKPTLEVLKPVKSIDEASLVDTANTNANANGNGNAKANSFEADWPQLITWLARQAS